MTNDIIFPDDPIAATKRTVTGWVDREGRFYGDDERMARWSGSTHKKCECGHVYPKSSWCSPCHERKMDEKWYAMEIVEYTGGPVVIHNSDHFYESLEDFLEQFDDEFDDDSDPYDCKLVLCREEGLREIDSSVFEGQLLEDGELPSDVEEAIDKFNEVIRNCKHRTWWPTNKRIIIKKEENV